MHKRKVDDVAEEILKGSSKKKVEQMFTGAVLRPWQEALEEYLRGEVDSRSIIWCWEPSGNVGKSWFATYCAVKHDAIVFGNGKSADIKYAYRGQRIVIFDLSRTQMERVNYQVIEDIKNGRYFSSKYISEMRVYAPPHVVCFQIVNRSLEHYLPIAGFCSTLQRTAWMLLLNHYSDKGVEIEQAFRRWKTILSTIMAALLQEWRVQMNYMKRIRSRKVQHCALMKNPASVIPLHTQMLYETSVKVIRYIDRDSVLRAKNQLLKWGMTEDIDMETL